MLDDLAAFGAPVDFIENNKDEDLEIFEDNWDAVTMFLRAFTQWNCSQGAFIGLNYQSVLMLFNLYKVKNKKELFEDIQIMEREALVLLNARNQ